MGRHSSGKKKDRGSQGKRRKRLVCPCHFRGDRCLLLEGGHSHHFGWNQSWDTV